MQETGRLSRVSRVNRLRYGQARQAGNRAERWGLSLVSSRTERFASEFASEDERRNVLAKIGSRVGGVRVGLRGRYEFFLTRRTVREAASHSVSGAIAANGGMGARGR